MNKILIIGPIGDFGGREVEVNFIARAIEKTYNVSILSTGYITASSFALRGLKNTNFNSVPKILFDKNLIIKYISKFNKFYNKGTLKTYGYVNNGLIKKFLNLDEQYIKILNAEINNLDLVILCAQLSSKYLKNIVEYCYKKKIKVIIRTTGTIRSFNISEYSFLKKVNLFIHHSESNAKNLNNQIKLPHIVIDQSALTESNLLNISLKKNKHLKFGYIGRLSKEKGIIPITKYFSKSNLPFIVAGDGPQKKELLNLFRDKSNCNYIGLVNCMELDLFYKKIDVLIIPSFEESGPLVALEAMASGKLIISTRVGAMVERLEGLKNIFWFNINDISTLHLKVEELNNMNNKSLFKVAEDFRGRYMNKYRNDLIFHSYQNAVKQILS